MINHYEAATTWALQHDPVTFVTWPPISSPWVTTCAVDHQLIPPAHPQATPPEYYSRVPATTLPLPQRVPFRALVANIMDLARCYHPPVAAALPHPTLQAAQPPAEGTNDAKKCGWCGTCTTSQWRVGPVSASAALNVLCNACGLSYRRAVKKTNGHVDLGALASSVVQPRQSIHKTLKRRLRQAGLSRFRVQELHKSRTVRMRYNTLATAPTPRLPPIRVLLNDIDLQSPKLRSFMWCCLFVESYYYLDIAFNKTRVVKVMYCTYACSCWCRLCVLFLSLEGLALWSAAACLVEAWNGDG